jgi:hypothetical protein
MEIRIHEGAHNHGSTRTVHVALVCARGCRCEQNREWSGPEGYPMRTVHVYPMDVTQKLTICMQSIMPTSIMAS